MDTIYPPKKKAERPGLAIRLFVNLWIKRRGARQFVDERYLLFILFASQLGQ